MLSRPYDEARAYWQQVITGGLPPDVIPPMS
jgi:hypothetical protein